MGLVGERRKLQQCGYARLDLRVFQTKVAAIDEQVFFATKVGVQRVHLAHHAELRFNGQCVLRHLQTQRVDAATVGHRQPETHANGGGLARAVGANHT